MNNYWWLAHLPMVILQLIACVGYIKGSWRFYKKENGFLTPLAVGIICDIIVTFVASSGILPRMEANQGVPWQSTLFITHISTACFGMFGFIFMWLYIVTRSHLPIKPATHHLIRPFQFWVFLPLWCLGVSIALANFTAKLIWQIRLFDYV